MRPLFLLLLVYLQFAAAEEPFARILFGSCIKQENPVPIFDAILARNPEIFLFPGDNIFCSIPGIFAGR